MKTLAKNSLVSLSAVFVFLTALWALVWRAPLGRDNWFLEPARRDVWPLSAWVFPVAVIVVCGAFAWVCAYDRFRRAKTSKEQRTSTRMTLGALVILATVWPWSLLGPLGGFQLVAALWSDVSNQYFSTAYRVDDARQFSIEYSKEQQDIEITKSHTATHPPGAVLLFYSAKKLYDGVPPLRNFWEHFAPAFTGANTSTVGETTRQMVRDATAENVTLPDEAIGGALWAAFLLSLSVGLTIPAVYKLARGDGRDEVEADRRGLLAATLFALAPTSALFAFTLDAPIAFLVAWSLVFWAKRQRTGSRFAALLCGAILGLASYLSFGALAVWGALIVSASLCWGTRSFVAAPILSLSDFLARREPAAHRPAPDLALALALALSGFMLFWLVILVLLPTPIWDVFSRAMEVHKMATLTSRSHAGWMLLNLFVFALFCGWPTVWGLLSQLKRVFEERRSGVMWHASRALGVAAIALCVGLSLVGTVRGETERLWLFLLAPLCVLAAIEYSKCDKKTVVVLTIMTAVQTLVLAGTLAPLVRPY